MILAAGTFNVRDYRKDIPWRAKLQALLNWICLRVDPQKDEGGPVYICAPIVPSWNAAEIEFDHDPALNKRDYDTVAGDFIPPQHDPKYIVPLHCEHHDHKTFGRAPGAAKTVTTRGSDVGEAKRTRDIRASEAAHQERLRTKGQPSVERPRRKSAIPSRGFDKRHRPLQSRNDLRKERT